jgi:hypothetical protein
MFTLVKDLINLFKKHPSNTSKDVRGGYQIVSNITIESTEDRHTIAFASESSDYRDTEKEALTLAEAKYNKGADVEVWKLINRYKH